MHLPGVRPSQILSPVSLYLSSVQGKIAPGF